MSYLLKAIVLRKIWRKDVERIKYKKKKGTRVPISFNEYICENFAYQQPKTKLNEVLEALH